MNRCAWRVRNSVEQGGHPLGLGHEVRLAHVDRDRLGLVAVGDQPREVAQVHDAHHVVDTPSPKTGRRERPALDGEVEGVAHTRDVASMPTMSMRGTITSRTIVSPNSITEWMKLRSSDSMASSSWATSAMASTSDSVMRGLLPLRAEQADHSVGDREQHDRDPADRPESQDAPHDRRARERRLVGVLNGEVLRDRLEGDEDDHDLAGRGDEDAGRAKEVAGEDADHRGRDQLADEHQQQQRVEELLGRLGERDERLGAVATLSRSERARDLFMRVSEVSAIAKKPESKQQHDDRHQQVGVARLPDRARSRRPRSVVASQQLSLARLHALGLLVDRVVPAAQVQDAVHDQQSDLVLEADLVLDRVARRHDGTDDDVTDQLGDLGRGRLARTTAARVGYATRGLGLGVDGKAQHVGRAVAAHELLIEVGDRTARR